MGIARCGHSDGRGAPVGGLAEVARTLEEAARIVRAHAADPPPAPPPPLLVPAAERALLRRIAAARRRRSELLNLPAGDHAWAMLLELYAAHLEGRRIPQTRLSLAAGVPETSGLRISRRLLASGLLTSTEDQADGRVTLLGLSGEAAARIRAWLSEAREEAPIAG